MLAKLDVIGGSVIYWLLVLFLGLAQESVGLYYQYVLNEWPCVLCIHVRLWVMLMILVALAGLWLRQYRIGRAALHMAMVAIAIGIFERAWILLGTERGTLQAECGIDLGMPAWLAIDQWMPQVFGVWTSCGYTPELWFGITMAEGLFVSSIVMALISLVFVLAVIVKGKKPGME